MPDERHHQRQAAESFGSDPERYDRARPRYPDVLIAEELEAKYKQILGI